MPATYHTLADLPKGTVMTFDRARARRRPCMSPGLYHAEMWNTEGVRYGCAVTCPRPPTLHDLIDHAQTEPAAWFLITQTTDA